MKSKKYLLFIILPITLSSCKNFLKTTPQTSYPSQTTYYQGNNSNFQNNKNIENLNKKILLLEYKIAQLTQSLENLEKKHNKDIQALQSQINALKEDQDAMSKSLDSISTQIDNIEQKLTNLEERVKFLENSYFRLVKVSKGLAEEDQKIKFLLRRNFQSLEKEIAYLKVHLQNIKRAIKKIPLIKVEELRPTK